MEMIYWERRLPERDDRDAGVNDAHPMRIVTEQVALDRSGWNLERSGKVRELFDSMAIEWASRNGSDRTEALIEALERLAPIGDTCLEVGCGTGSVLGHLGEKFPRVLGVDLALEMLHNSQCRGMAMVQADSSNLPIANNSVDVIVVVNSFLFAEEFKRVLVPKGTIVWVSTNGDRTPIYLAPEKVHEVLGEEFFGVNAKCGNGVWSGFSRERFWPNAG